MERHLLAAVALVGAVGLCAGGAPSSSAMGLYALGAAAPDGTTHAFSRYAGQVALVVNVASE